MVRTLAALALILPVATAAFASAPDLWLEAEVEPARALVQTQAIYRLRFYQGVDVRDFQMHGPSVPLAEVRPIGEIRVREAQREGRRYRVHERAYAVFPFASGRLDLAGAHATGRIAAIGGNSADGRRSIRIEAPAQSVTVLPLPAGAPALAARNLVLSETWTPDAPDAQVGEARQRIIRIEAAGVDAGQLPEIRFDIPGVTVHAEPPRLENRFRGEINVASREQVFTLVPQRGGELVVPELRLDWWDATASQPTSAILAARTLHAAGGAPAPASNPVTAPGVDSSLALSRLSLGVAALLSALAVLVWMRRVHWLSVLRLRRACRTGQAGAVRDALLAHAAMRWPDAPPLSLEELAERLSDPTVRRSLESLERSIYGPKPGACDADTRAAAMRLLRHEIS